MSTTEQTGRPGKYQRSAFGLIVALVTTVVLVVGVMWLMSLFRNETEVKPPHVDYRDAVAAAQDGGLATVYPAELPSGYFATQAAVAQDDDGHDDGFEIDLLDGDTADADFIGIRVAHRADIEQLVHENVDKEASTAASYVVGDGVAHPLARTWTGYRDSGGDTGYAAKVGKLKVLVYGSAPTDDLKQVVDALSQAPIQKRAGKR